MLPNLIILENEPNLLSLGINNIECWMSGHTHYSYDFNYKETRFISNQFGYIDEINNSEINYDGLFEI